MRAKVMMPTVFCASLEPWEKPIMPAESSWSLPKLFCTLLGRIAKRTIIIVSSAMKITPRVKPMKGEMSIGLISLGQRPTVLPLTVSDQIETAPFEVGLAEDAAAEAADERVRGARLGCRTTT
jgi:hypothetical protein